LQRRQSDKEARGQTLAENTSRCGKEADVKARVLPVVVGREFIGVGVRAEVRAESTAEARRGDQRRGEIEGEQTKEQRRAQRREGRPWETQRRDAER
jgi:hypothetical protein